MLSVSGGPWPNHWLRSFVERIPGCLARLPPDTRIGPAGDLTGLTMHLLDTSDVVGQTRSPVDPGIPCNSGGTG